jgi:hypothetical protein
MLVSLALALSLTAAPDAGTAPSGPFRTKAAVPAAQVMLPKDTHPLLSNPQISVDGSKIYVARVDAPPGELRSGIHISIVSPNGKTAPTALDMPAPVLGDDVQLLLSPNERTIATLAAGELWVRALNGKDEPRRLYPPATGDAPIGPRLTHAAFARDSSYLLIQSPLGWGRVAVATGELDTLGMKPIDLTGGSMALSPDDTHVMIVKPQTGEGYQNGANVLALNVETGSRSPLHAGDVSPERATAGRRRGRRDLGAQSDGTLRVLQAAGAQSWRADRELCRRPRAVDAFVDGGARIGWQVAQG